MTRLAGLTRLARLARLAKNCDEFPLVVLLSFVVNLERRLRTVGRYTDEAAGAGYSSSGRVGLLLLPLESLLRLLRELGWRCYTASAVDALLLREPGLLLLLLLLL